MAVYTEVSPADCATLLADYDIGDMQKLTGITAGVENSNFRLETTKGLYILTLYEGRVDADDLPYFMDLMAHLSEQGFACPTPIARRDGGYIAQVNGRAAAVVDFLQGVSVKTPKPPHCYAAGAMLAALHQATTGFAPTRRNSLSLSACKNILSGVVGDADRVMAGLAQELQDIFKRLVEGWQDDLPRGTIHADYFPDNVFFMGGRVSGVIDFYFACTDMLAYDLAIALNAWCFEDDKSFNITKARDMVAGYQSVRGLSDAELEALPILAMGAAMRFLLTRLQDWVRPDAGALVRPKNPQDYLARLRFHNKARGLADYGLSQDRRDR